MPSRSTLMSSTVVLWTSNIWRVSRSCLQLANREGLATVAFPAISCGVYAFPYPRAAKARVPALTRLWIAAGLPCCGAHGLCARCHSPALNMGMQPPDGVPERLKSPMCPVELTGSARGCRVTMKGPAQAMHSTCTKLSQGMRGV
jgi:hypothetical protein